jgi:phage shock protein PspC (stress-responsive transcriptional regulator)
MVAGVAGGVAERLGIDPLVVRVLVVVLALFGGAGLLFYALGWLLIPDESTDQSLVEQAFGPRRDGRSSSLLLAVGLGLLAVATVGGILSDNFSGVLLMALLLLGGAFLLRRNEDRPPLPPAGGSAPSGYLADTWQPTASGQPGGPAGWPAGSGSTGSGTTGYGSTDAGTAGAAPPGGAPPGWSGATTPGEPLGARYATPAGVPPWYGASEPAWRTPPPAPRRPRSVLFPLTLSAMAVVLGVLGALDASGVAIPAATYWAWALGVVGIGLLIGTWFGRSRGLIVVGLLLIPVLAVTAAANQLGDLDLRRGATDVTVTPTTVAQVEAIDGDYGAGSITYDLSRVDFAGEDVQMSARVGAGELVVLVPRGVEVTVDAEVGLGEADVIGTTQGGPGIDLQVTKPGAPDAGTVTLDLSVGLGTVEVSRAAA